MTHSEIIEKWPDIDSLARDLEFKYFRVYQWWNRNAIPLVHWKAVVEAAKRRKIRGITLQVLAEAKDE